MSKISRLSGCRDWIDLGFVERERTPESAMALGIQSHVAGLSLSNTVELLEAMGVQRSRKAVHDWVQKADLQPESGKSPNQIVLDETVIRINDQQFWLYAADPATNELLHVQLFSTTTTALTDIFLRELREKHDVETAVFLVDGAQTSKLHFPELDFDFRCVVTEIGMPSNECFENFVADSRRFRTASATPNRKPPKHGCRPSLAGTMLQTKHYPWVGVCSQYERAPPLPTRSLRSLLEEGDSAY